MLPPCGDGVSRRVYEKTCIYRFCDYGNKGTLSKISSAQNDVFAVFKDAKLKEIRNMGKDTFLPPTGTRDIEPFEAQTRDMVINAVSASFKKYGFNSVETPSLEKLENLIGKKGGENEKLIFKILKRGDELKESLGAQEENFSQENSLQENTLSDLGLRYDLTIPLARYYAHFKDKLPKPFKVFQIGNVWRAERPQKSRYRQFTQCDIDIIGDASPACEIELIYVICKTLRELNIKNFEIRVNDRRILRAISRACGIESESEYRDFLIAFDKLDKKPLEEVVSELKDKNFPESVLKNVKKMFQKLAENKNSIDTPRALLDKIESEEYLKACENIENIIKSVRSLCEGIIIRFDPSLVRGMDYYTGTIFEVNEINGRISFGGGGRYDNMIGSFSGQDVCACGFSLGFERIIDAFFSKAGEIFQTPKKAAITGSLI